MAAGYRSPKFRRSKTGIASVTLIVPNLPRYAVLPGFLPCPFNQRIYFFFRASNFFQFREYFTFRKILRGLQEAASPELRINPDDPKHFGVCPFNLDDAKD